MALLLKHPSTQGQSKNWQKGLENFDIDNQYGKHFQLQIERQNHQTNLVNINMVYEHLQLKCFMNNENRSNSSHKNSTPLSLNLTQRYKRIHVGFFIELHCYSNTHIYSDIVKLAEWSQ